MIYFFYFTCLQYVDTIGRSTKWDRPSRPRMAVTNVDVGLGGESHVPRENVEKVRTPMYDTNNSCLYGRLRISYMVFQRLSDSNGFLTYDKNRFKNSKKKLNSITLTISICLSTS